jgi:hypothetical protein
MVLKTSQEIRKAAIFSNMLYAELTNENLQKYTFNSVFISKLKIYIDIYNNFR